MCFCSHQPSDSLGTPDSNKQNNLRSGRNSRHLLDRMHCRQNTDLGSALHLAAVLKLAKFHLLSNQNRGGGGGGQLLPVNSN